MKILLKTKLFKRKDTWWVSLRDYELGDEPILVRVAEEWMKLEVWQLTMDREQFTKEVFKTKVGSKKHPEYTLYDYEWKPTPEAKELGEKLTEEEEMKTFSKQVLS